MTGEKLLVLVIFTIGMTIALVLNILYRNQFFDEGVNFIYDYQMSQPQSGIEVIQNIISIFGNTIFIIVFLLFIHLVFKRKLATIVYLSYIIFNAYLISVQKQAYQDPRPYYYNSNIQQTEWGCPRSYGFPSGHSWISILLYQPVISDLIGVGRRKRGNLPIQNTEGSRGNIVNGCTKYRLLLTIPVLTGVLIPISRMYLGSHSADQVTCGILHSVGFLMLYKFIFQEQIYKLCLNCMGNSVTSTSTMAVIILSLFTQCVSIFVPMLIYGINMSQRPFPSQYLTLMNEVCGSSYDQNKLQNQAGLSATVFSIVFGLIYGWMINRAERVRQVLYNTNHTRIDGATATAKNQCNIALYKMYMAGQYEYHSCKQVLLYLLCYAVTGGVFVGGISFGISAGINNFYGKYIIQTIGYTLFGMSITFLIPYTLIRCHLINYSSQAHEIDPSNIQLKN